MKENFDIDQYDLNQPQQKPAFQNISESNQFTIVIHFSPTKSFSFTIPDTWDCRKLISFISLTFKSELRHKIPSFIFNGMKLPFNETPLKEYLNSSKINHILITLQDRETMKSQIIDESTENKENNHEHKNKLKNIYSLSNNEIFKSEEFNNMEKSAIDDYNKIFKESTFNNFPIMSPAYNKRREQIKYDSQTERLAQFEPIPLEDFPFSNYFQLKILFKCFISFFALGIYIKGFNFVLFLFVLVGYYWYCINNIMDEFYRRKFQQIGLGEDEYKRIGKEIKELGKKLGNLMGDKDENEEEESDNENENDDEKKDENENVININKEGNNNINIDLEEEKKENDTFGKIDEVKIIKEPMKDLEFKEETKQENDNKKLNENIKNANKKSKKKEEKKEEKNENEIEEQEEPTPLQIAYQILYVFFISFIPPWCDEFEAQNPLPVNNPPNGNNNNNNNENQNNNNENNINNNNFNNNINNDINDNNIGQASSNSPQQEEDSNNNKMTSSKVVNMSEDSNRDNKMFNLIKKDNQSLNENEYVFSENGGIDSLSMNSEIYKQKKEKEKEKEKDKDNKEIKEKQIFEEEEDEKIIDDNNNHLKNE